MEHFLVEGKDEQRVTFKTMSVPAKALSTCIIVVMTFGMLGALGQVIVHDIIPTFYSESTSAGMQPMSPGHGSQAQNMTDFGKTSNRGDLFSDLPATDTQSKTKPFYQEEQFVWTLKWSHIHLFGMGMIFIFMGVISLLLDAGIKLRTWLIVLPFIGVLIDILAMWLKGFVSPVFFWLHVPGGGVFALVFGYVSIRALSEMWTKPVEN
jgi:hypothetical protein